MYCGCYCALEAARGAGNVMQSLNQSPANLEAARGAGNGLVGHGKTPKNLEAARGAGNGTKKSKNRSSAGFQGGYRRKPYFSACSI